MSHVTRAVIVSLNGLVSHVTRAQIVRCHKSKTSWKLREMKLEPCLVLLSPGTWVGHRSRHRQLFLRHPPGPW
ncbi:hypothetical protein BS47DRAFT_396691 [Hydnum rufescens UP504]|uniref:Uncharacterized protein n=1 Tax=Hydnum rufescens UP504 TaxID=1448309 RepID=A0A9P6AJ74_9AGAM|nr:hypothetical protein BS47DRAFT_396691 [Hydnum rufescens UP504]